MKFEELCHIILEDSKPRTKVVVVNSSPTFSQDDISRDVGDVSKGLKTYLDEDLKGLETDDTVDEERKGRRALRRINWVTNKVIRKAGKREVDLRKLFQYLTETLKAYLKSVLRYNDETIDDLEMSIAKEAALIGNMLLPPTDHYKSGKGAFSMPVSVDADSKNGEPPVEGGVAEHLRKEFNQIIEDYMSEFDPDLIDTIKEVIQDTTSTANDNPTPTEISVDTEVEDEEASVTESATVGEILKDPRIKNVFSPKVVRKVVKSLLSMGTLKSSDGGILTLSDGEATSDTEDSEEIDDPVVPDAPEDFGAEECGCGMSPESGSIDDEEDQEDDSSWYK